MNRKQKISTGLSFGLIMTIVFVVQNLLFNDNDTTKQVIISIASGLLTGALSGVLFGWLMGALANSKRFQKMTTIKLEPGETILFETMANHFKGIEAVGGKLFLTQTRLVFKSHKVNIQPHELSISVASIESVERYKTIGLVNNGLAITHKCTTEKFVVQEIDGWIKLFAEKTLVSVS